MDRVLFPGFSINSATLSGMRALEHVRAVAHAAEHE